MTIYSIRQLNKRRYNIPNPFGYLAKKNSKGHWVSICYDEQTNTNLGNKSVLHSNEYVNIDNVEDVVLQIDNELGAEQLKEFEASIMGKYIPSGNYVPCLWDEKIMLIKTEFLTPVIA